MILDDRLIAEAEARFGVPLDLPLEAALDEYELEMVFLAAEAAHPRHHPLHRWVTVEELQGPIREALMATARSLFRYRVTLTDATVAELVRLGFV